MHPLFIRFWPNDSSTSKMGLVSSFSWLGHSLVFGILTAIAIRPSSAAEWHVATQGTATGTGEAESPWDLASACAGPSSVQPGDIIWIHAGTYRHPNRGAQAMGYEIRLAGAAGRPIQLRNADGERVIIDGGLTVREPSTHLWIQGLEIIVSENFTRSRRLEETGSHPESYQRPWGGLNVYSGTGCKFIHLSIHDNAQGVSWWTGSTDSELYGCVIYNNGWTAPDRGHGHAVYTQNKDGIKTIRDCILTGGYGYTLHAYGSSRAYVDNYLAAHNICYDGGQFLIGGGRPSHGIRVLSNYLHRVDVRLGYNAPHNEDCEVRGNIIRGALRINAFRDVVREDDRVYESPTVPPEETVSVVRPSVYETGRAHVAVFNWAGRTETAVDASSVLEPGDGFRLLNPTNEFGLAVATGRTEDGTVVVPLEGEFAAYILKREGHPARVESGKEEGSDRP